MHTQLPEASVHAWCSCNVCIIPDTTITIIFYYDTLFIKTLIPILLQRVHLYISPLMYDKTELSAAYVAMQLGCHIHTHAYWCIYTEYNLEDLMNC